MRLCLIVNPNAGRRNGLGIGSHVCAELKRAGIHSETLVSSRAGETRTIAARLDPGEWDGVVAVGGDGTLFDVVNGLLASRERIPVPIGQIPVGTGNSFIRDLGVTTVDEALAPIVAGSTRRVDLGRFTSPDGEYAFMNLLGAGFVSDVAHRASRYKGRGTLSYLLATLREVVTLAPSAVTLTIDGRIIEREVIFVEVCNSRFTGGAMMMAPTARIDDGLFDVVVAGAMPRRNVLALLPLIFSGRHVDSPLVEVFRGARVTLVADRPLALTPDGETFGATPITATVEPGAVEVYAT